MILRLPELAGFTYSGLRTVLVWLEKYRYDEVEKAGKMTDLQ